MKALADAIYGQYAGAGGAALRALMPRFYFQQAPEKAVFPYGVYSIVAGSQDDTFLNECEDYTVQFDIYTQDYAATANMAIYETFAALYDYAALTLVGWTCSWCRRELQDLTFDDGVWRTMTQYSIRISR